MPVLETILLYVGLTGYALGLLFTIRYIRGRGNRDLRMVRIASLSAALVHAALLAASGAHDRSFPIATLFEAVVLLGVLLTLAGLAIDLVWSIPLLTVAMLPIVLTCLMTALAFLQPQQGSKPLPFLISVHTMVTLLSYAAFGLGFILSVIYLIEHRQLKVRFQSPLFDLLPSLERVYRLTVQAVAAGFFLLTAGIVMGYLYARSVSPGAGWRMDPKVWLTTLTWVAYLVVLVLASMPSLRGRKIAMVAIVSFCLVMVTLWASLFWKDFHHFV